MAVTDTRRVCLWIIFIIVIIIIDKTACISNNQLGHENSEGVEKSKQSGIQRILNQNVSPKEAQSVKLAQEKLQEIYLEKIKPLADTYHFSDLNCGAFSEGDIFAKPMIVFLGPWSTGKSTMINYFLGIEGSPERLNTGAEPTTSDFTVLTYGPEYRVIQGIQLVADKNRNYAGLQKFGLKFMERFQGTEIPSKLLEKVTLVDTPGIIENKKQQERGYPFNEVCQWFIERAQLVFLVFDPSKLDMGSELETLFNQLKGHEGKLRLILNKADTVSPQELMRVYGALFWALAPLVNEVEPPRVYVVSLWSSPFRAGTMHPLFHDEEQGLMKDLERTINFHLENKIAAARRHAFLVRLHAYAVDTYRQIFYSKKSMLGDNDKLWAEILKAPAKHSVFSKLQQQSGVSEHDLPTPSTYEHFFSVNSLEDFSALFSRWTFWEDNMDRLNSAINVDLPNLLHKLKTANTSQGYCKKDSGQC